MRAFRLRQRAALWSLLAVVTLACNLLSSAPAPSTSAPPTNTAPPGSAPTVSVLWPPSGSEFVVGEEITIHVSASDVQGATRIQLRSASSVLSSRPSPERDGQPTFDAILSWRPTRSGSHDVAVVAYRHLTASQPFPLTLVIRDRTSEVIATPVPFTGESASGPTALPQPGAVCQVRVDINDLRFRAGPGTDYAILGLLDLGEILNVTGQNSAGTWWQVIRQEQTVWVSSDRNYSTPLSDCSGAPVVSPP